MSLRDRLGNWLASLILGKGWEGEVVAPEPPPVDVVEPAPDDAPTLGPEAEAMLASPGPQGTYEGSPPAPPLEGSAAERLARLRLR